MRQALIERTEEGFIIIGTNNDGKVSNIELTEELSSAIQVIETAVDETADPVLLEAKQRAAEAERRLQESQAQIIETEQRIEQIQTQVDETVQKLENVQVQVTEKDVIITELTAEVDSLREKVEEFERLVPEWKVGIEAKEGSLYRYNGAVYQVKIGQSHTTQDNWNPERSNTLWSRMGEVEEVATETTPAWSEGNYPKDFKVTHKDKTWVSMIDNNTWEPGAPGVFENIWKAVDPA